MIKEEDPQLFNILADILMHNGIAVLKCDTIYGIIGLLDNSEKRIAEIKQRNMDKPFVCLIADKEWVSEYAEINIPEKFKKYWPGPLTLIFPAKSGKTNRKSIALRVPLDKFLIKLLKKIGKPLISSSVNIEGEKPLYKINDIIKNFEDKVDLIVDNGDLSPLNLASTLIDLHKKPYKILRQGELIIPDDEMF